MIDVNQSYKLFGLDSTCSEEKLRCAFRQAIHRHHPDRNPDDDAANEKTREIIDAYTLLKEQRSSWHPDPNFATFINLNFDSIEIGIEFGKVYTDDIITRKRSFREKWQVFQRNPNDIIASLRLIHAAFNAGQHDVIGAILRQQIIIDSAPLLISDSECDVADETITKWARYLHNNGMDEQAIQMLEDALVTKSGFPEAKEELRKLHYWFAQGRGAELKPAPAIRIKHLRRILELGFKFDYIHKLLAEAYFDFGNKEEAKNYLRRAYEINTNLNGAAQISRALGFLPEKAPTRVRRNSTKSIKLKNVPTPSKIREWAVSENWNEILTCAALSNYSPSIMSKVRETIRQVSASLSKCTDERAVEHLIGLLKCTYSEVRETSIVSLSRIGGPNVLKALRRHRAERLEKDYLKIAVSYVKARMSNGFLVDQRPAQLIEQAECTFKEADFGRARMILEHVVKNLDNQYPGYYGVLFLLARSCEEAGDYEQAVRLIKPTISKFPVELLRDANEHLSRWIKNWLSVGVSPYDSDFDEYYSLAVEICLKNVLFGATPEVVLRDLTDLKYWMVQLGQIEMAIFIRDLIGKEAPGTSYVDTTFYEKSKRRVEVKSTRFVEKFAAISVRIVSEVPLKLRDVLGTGNPSLNPPTVGTFGDSA